MGLLSETCKGQVQLDCYDKCCAWNCLVLEQSFSEAVELLRCDATCSLGVTEDYCSIELIQVCHAQSSVVVRDDDG